MSARPFLIGILITATISLAAAGGTNEWTTGGPYGGDVTVLVADAASPGTVYAGTSGGVFKSTDGAATWTAASGGLPPGEIHALVLAPQNPATLYAATPGFTGIFRTSDGGGSWRPLALGFPDAGDVNALAIDPASVAAVYAGTAAGGLFRSSDGGDTWQPADGGAGDVRSIAVAPGPPPALFTATGDGVFRSTDGGDTWQALSQGLVPGAYDKIVVDPSTPNTVYALVLEAFSRLFKSTDAGDSWQEITFGGSSFLRDLAVDPSDSGVLYAATSSNSDVFKSTDGGETWSGGSDGITAILLRSVIVDPHDPAAVYVGTDLDHGVFKSTDGGAVFTAANRGLAATNVQDLAIDPQEPSTIFAGSDNGVFKSTDGGETWAAANDGLLNVPIESLAIDPQNPEKVFGGSDLAFFAPGVYSSTDGGDSWQLATVLFQVNGSVEALAIDPEDPSTVYATNSDDLLKSVDGGATWADVDVPGSFLLDLALAPSAPATLYATTISLGLTSRIWKTVDGGDSWSDADAGIPGNFITLALDVDPTTADTVYATGLGGVYRSLDGGASWQPTAPVFADFGIALAIDPQTPATLYATTIEGVSKSLDRGDRWFPVGGPLPQVAFDLEVDPRDPAIVHAGTLNGGVFTLNQAPGCVPGPTTLCLDDRPGDRRFEVTLAFETEFGDVPSGDARATSLAPLGITRGGILSFFGPSNPEVLVKVLDGCGFNDHFWVFYAATTTVGFEMRVTDTFTGMRQTYRNPDQTTAATVTDIEAFPVCSAGPPESAPLDPGLRAPEERRRRARDGTPRNSTNAGKGAGTCVADATTLCIDDRPGDRRFRVTATFDTVLGGAGEGDAEAIPLASLGITRGGILSFFDAANPEVLVKVLDGCGFNDRFWIFYAATTNAGFTLRVEDTVAGVERVFTNPDLTAAAPVTEIDAFATCDL